MAVEKGLNHLCSVILMFFGKSLAASSVRLIKLEFGGSFLQEAFVPFNFGIVCLLVTGPGGAVALALSRTFFLFMPRSKRLFTSHSSSRLPLPVASPETCLLLPSK